MNKQFKKIFSILFALAVGGIIIFYAWRGGSLPVETGADTTLPTNTEWRNVLSVVPQKYSPNKIASFSNGGEGGGEPATTTTALIARRLLLEYSASQAKSATTTLSESEARRIATNLAKEVRLPPKKQYTLADLNISPDNSRVANETYIKEINTLTGQPIGGKNQKDPITIVTVAMETNNPTHLKDLSVIANAYGSLIKKLLALPTPSTVASTHLRVVNASETLRRATVSLQNILEDPIVGIAALAEYRSGIEEFLVIRQEYRNFFKNY